MPVERDSMISPRLGAGAPPAVPLLLVPSAHHRTASAAAMPGRRRRCSERLALRQHIDELVQLTDLLHQPIFNLLHAHAADDALDQGSTWMHARRLREEGLASAPLTR